MKKLESELLTYAEKLHLCVEKIHNHVQGLQMITNAPTLYPAHIRIAQSLLEKIRTQNKLVALYAEHIRVDDLRRAQKQERDQQQRRLH